MGVRLRAPYPYKGGTISPAYPCKGVAVSSSVLRCTLAKGTVPCTIHGLLGRCPVLRKSGSKKL